MSDRSALAARQWVRKNHCRKHQEGLWTSEEKAAERAVARTTDGVDSGSGFGSAAADRDDVVDVAVAAAGKVLVG